MEKSGAPRCEDRIRQNRRPRRRHTRNFPRCVTLPAINGKSDEFVAGRNTIKRGRAEIGTIDRAPGYCHTFRFNQVFHLITSSTQTDARQAISSPGAMNPIRTFRGAVACSEDMPLSTALMFQEGNGELSSRCLQKYWKSIFDRCRFAMPSLPRKHYPCRLSRR
jgi:hypothetical protein